ncbi:hypothetical protein [Rhodovulum sulfidophilum]|uniref:hypothetical protein n=1 Tax=Rhodovulum sulfidophilum TaxID=35806 RepID=UPI0034DEC4A0
MRAFNIPFNSTALQNLAAGTEKEVTVHLDPDDLREVYVTAEGVKEVAKTHLSMTIFKDQSLEEAIEIMENATASNPSLRVLHEENLSEREISCTASRLPAHSGGAWSSTWSSMPWRLPLPGGKGWLSGRISWRPGARKPE